MFPALAACFFAILAMSIALPIAVLVRWRMGARPVIPGRAWAIVGTIYAAYGLFTWLGTGPTTKPSMSHYRAPWPDDAVSCVAQGHRSLVSHRGTHHHAVDFVRPMGTPILAARAGTVVTVVDSRTGVGWFEGNNIVIEHEDGSRALYAHLAQDTARVVPGDRVAPGEHIADIGMVGKTLFPHVHFVVLDAAGASIPEGFVGMGVPRASRCYTAKS